MQKIAAHAFDHYSGYTSTSDTLIIPWGVTSIGERAFSIALPGKLVIPDTAINLGSTPCADVLYTYWIPSRNNLTAWEKWYPYYNSDDYPDGYELRKKWEERYLNISIEGLPYDNIASYYDLRPNTLKTAATGKLYYIDENYQMAKGWTQVNGDWYYFNDYGAAAVKCWMENDGRKYFLQADGTMAKNKWINWYSTWYYVGSDGAMYKNCYTPDGYWVNAAGAYT